MDCGGTSASQVTSAFGGHRVRPRGCPDGTQNVSAREGAEGDPTPCRLRDRRSACQDVPSKRLADRRTEGAGQPVRGLGFLRNGRKGPGLWDHAFPLPPRLSQRDALLRLVHAGRIPDAGGGRDPKSRLWPTRSGCATAHSGGRVEVCSAAQRKDAALGASERTIMTSTFADQPLERTGAASMVFRASTSPRPDSLAEHCVTGVDGFHRVPVWACPTGERSRGDRHEKGRGAR
jgi:hypothetical protein